MFSSQRLGAIGSGFAAVPADAGTERATGVVDLKRCDATPTLLNDISF
jgi:hypothetical protein